MPDCLCNSLDDYMDNALSDADREVFERHMAECDECKEAATLQGKLEDALCNYASLLEPPVAPVRLNPASRAVSEKVLAVCGVLVAMLLVAFIASQALDQPGSTPKLVVRKELSSTPQPQPDANADDDAPRFRSIESNEHLVVIEPPAGDDLTVIMLYPKVFESDDLYFE